MGLIVAKFGGTSVADIEHIETAAAKIAREAEAGHHIAVVVSAMAGVTNDLIAQCEAMSDEIDMREHDTVVASGEQVTSGLMALALQKRGLHARSWTASQLPFTTDTRHGKARIVDVRTEEMITGIRHGQIPVLAGFQGISPERRLTTLGRGGSDTSAVALAAALGADRCDIYTDVTGVFTADPRIVRNARRIDRISYEEMLELASMGARVLQVRAVEMAKKYNVRVQVLSSFEDVTGSDEAGTLVVPEEEMMEEEQVHGITYSENEAKITLMSVPDKPGIAADVFAPLAEKEINVDMIVQNIAADGRHTDMTFTVPRDDRDKALEALQRVQFLRDNNIEMRAEEDVAKISIVGVGMKSHAGVARTMFETLAAKGVNIQVISTSEIKISVLIPAEYTELAVRALHEAYQLDRGG